jgi:hypothetical protein
MDSVLCFTPPLSNRRLVEIRLRTNAGAECGKVLPKNTAQP